MGDRKEIVVALDWTEFDGDNQATICLYLITRHGRATPLVWKTVPKATLAGKRNDYEYSVVEQLGSILTPEVKITLLADRGFGDQKFYAILGTFGRDYVIRFRDCIFVTDASGVWSCWPPRHARRTLRATHERLRCLPTRAREPSRYLRRALSGSNEGMLQGAGSSHPARLLMRPRGDDRDASSG